MNNINHINHPAIRRSQAPGSTKETLPSQNSSRDLPKTATTPPSVKINVSSISRALSNAASRAAERDASTSRGGLLAIAIATSNALLGEDYLRDKTAHDAEVPNSDDPLRLAQAQQATDFSNGKGINPFKGMPHDQLTLIAYDDSGSFTVNERRAALDESCKQESAWQLAMVKKMEEEESLTGKISAGTYREILAHYKSLPAIDEANIPAGYEVQLQIDIQQAENSEPSPHRKELKHLFDLFETQLNESKKT